MSNNDTPFQLIAWIKRDQEERRQHQLKMAYQNHKDDAEFMELIGTLILNWSKLRIKEKELVLSLIRHREQGMNFTPMQRSAITGMYVRRCA